MRYIFCFCFVFVLVIEGVAQNFNLSQEKTLERLFLFSLDTSSDFHSSIKPFSKNETAQVGAWSDGNSKKSDSKCWDKLLHEHWIDVDNDKFRIAFDPIVNTGLTLENGVGKNSVLRELSLGLNFKGSFSEKWSAQLAFLADNSTYPEHVSSLIQEKNISPGYGYWQNDRANFVQGNITFTPDSIFTIQAGYGKNFIGDGYRSLFLSDYANSYPYLKVTGSIWKIKYMSLFTNFQDISYANGKRMGYRNKFSAIHYLSWNATRWLNFGLFETVIWQAQEGSFYRGYDISYLNPILLLRPAEYARGSADNALLGASLKVRVKKKNIAYAQLLLDEFLLGEIRDGNGWWANKYGIQVGAKSYDLLGIKNLQLQVEYNLVRPFTYSYYYKHTGTSALQNYGHFNAPLAHPLGSNFKEVYAGLSYQKERLVLEAIITAAKVGLDVNDTTSIGQDVFRPYNDRTSDYGHFITQGLSTDIINKTARATYIVNPKSQMALQLAITHRTYRNAIEDNTSVWVFFGIKTLLINRYMDY